MYIIIHSTHTKYLVNTTSKDYDDNDDVNMYVHINTTMMTQSFFGGNFAILLFYFDLKSNTPSFIPTPSTIT